MTDPEDLLRLQIAECWDDPLRFVMLVFPWGEKGGPLEKHDGPDEWQQDQLNAIRDHIREGKPVSLRDATTSGHGIGKTAETSWIILWFMSTRPNCAGVVTANTQTQLSSKTWRELSLWHKRALNAHWFKWTATRFFAVEAPETWRIDAIAWSEHNPEAFAGLHAEDVLVIFDEASAVADTIWEVTEGAMTTQGAMWFAYGNPTRNTGRFRECFSVRKHRWRTRQVDSRTCKMTNKAEIDQWVEDYGDDSDFVRVRVKGQFPRASSNQLISVEVADNARKRTIEDVVYTRYPLILGVDVARYGDDRSVLTLRQGPQVWMPQAFREISTMELVGKVIEIWREQRVDAICVDGIGIGAGVVDRLKELGAPVVDVQSAATAGDTRKYLNSRAEMWDRTADWLDDASLPDDQELIDELTAIQYGYNAKLQMQIEGKADLKKRILISPDKADSLVMTFSDTDKVARAMAGSRRRMVRPVKPVSAAGWT